MSAYTCENNFDISGAHLKAKQTATDSIYKQELTFQKGSFYLFEKTKS